MGRFDSGIGAKGVIGKLYAALAQEIGATWLPLIANYFKSDQATETYKWLGMVPQMREWVGERIAKGLREQGFTLSNQKYEATLEVLNDDLRRDKTGQLDLRISELAKRAAAHFAKLITTLIINGTGSNSGLCYDGQYFFDSDHIEGDSGTLTNLLTATEVTELNVTTAAAPTPEEMAKAIMGVIEYFFSYTDDQGEPINEDAKGFLVMVPTGLWSPARQAISMNFLSTGSGVIDNPLRNLDDLQIKLAANPRLTTEGSWTTNFCVFRTDAPTKPFIIQEETGLEISHLGIGSDHEFKNDSQLFGVKTSRAAGYGLWQRGVHCTLS